jgi:hypothetical protein
MANIYLGISGSETLLPTITGLGGALPDSSVNEEKLLQESTMSDGSRRFGLIAKKRRWSYSWGLLTYAELQSFQTLYGLAQVLHFQDNFESSTWYNVVFLAFTFAELRGVSATTKYYSASIALLET